MNKLRRKALGEIVDQIEALKERIEELKTSAEGIRDSIETIRDQEQEAFDNLPSGLQEGEKGQDMQFAVGKMDEVFEAFDAVFECLEGTDLATLASTLDEARGQDD